MVQGVWIAAVILAVSLLGLAVIGAHWRRWGYEKAFDDLHAATDDLKAELGKALLPAMRRVEKALTRLP